MYKSCGVTHENNYLIYGGREKRQILKLVDCGLTSIGELDFDHDKGACASSDGVIYLCFHQDDSDQCRQSASPLGPWSLMTKSTHYHRWTSIASSPGNSLVVGISSEVYFQWVF